MERHPQEQRFCLARSLIFEGNNRVARSNYIDAAQPAF
jgi:hypothetical protein